MRTTSLVGALAPLALCSVLATSNALAGPSDYVITPIVEEGEREIDLKAGSAKLRDDTRNSNHSLGLGLGVNRWWFTEVYAIWHKPPGEEHSFDAWEWENRFQLTETGKYPLDIGLLLEIERPKDRREGYEVRWGVLLQSDLTSELQANLNLLFEKRIRSSSSGRAELGYQWQLKHRWKPSLEFGLQGFGDVGPWNDWEPRTEQPHVAGPAIFGRAKISERQAIKYSAGLLFGMTNGSARNVLRVQAEYEY